MLKGAHPRQNSHKSSQIRRRILTINLLALAILVAGLMYLGEYKKNLIATEIAALETQAEIFAVAIGEGGVSTDVTAKQILVEEVVRQMVRRLVVTTGTRARLFNNAGMLVADSRSLIGYGGLVQAEKLVPLANKDKNPIHNFLDDTMRLVISAYDNLSRKLLVRSEFPLYRESANQRADQYPEVLAALSGSNMAVLRTARNTGIIINVAVPVRRYKHVLGALMLSKGSRHIDDAMFQVRLDILKVFTVALTITIGLSLYLARTIAYPIHHLAKAAEMVRHGHHRQHEIPDFANRTDEIGELATALRDMTEALWQRMDAIESFAADVSHEIKNPLTSLNSAVETAARIKDPEQQRQLMAIIQEDVKRLDRLINDISNASRLDAELSRDRPEPVDIGRMLEALVEAHKFKDADNSHPIHLEIKSQPENEMRINALEGRIAQVFNNLIDNAISFSPIGKPITINAARNEGWIEITISDHGPGIPKGKEEAIFERFYTERPKAEKFGVHSGLGLGISKQIVESHGGMILAQNLESDDGTVLGAQFVVRLPTEY